MEVPPPPQPFSGVQKYIRKKCPHGKQKHHCAACGGASVCEHQKLRNDCLDCGGSSICEHGKRRCYCRDCKGSCICRHGKHRNQCKECEGSSICTHGRHRSYCKDCGGSSMCEHGRRRIFCRDCGGVGFCPHGKRPYVCRDCGGASMCQHGKAKYQCKDCNNFICKALTKSKELDIHQALQKAYVDFEYQKHLPFRGCGLASETAYAYIDFCVQMSWGVILLECDEQQHNTYDPSCDVRRDFDSCASIALGSQHKAVVLRYNPDAFKVGGRTKYTTKKERQAKLIATLHLWEDDPAPSLGFARFFLFYDAESDDAPLPLIAQHWSEDVRAVSRRIT